MSVKRLVGLLGDIFWSSMIVIGLLIAGFFFLRLLANVGRGGILSRASTTVAGAATPQG
jgi:hypothetical protein